MSQFNTKMWMYGVLWKVQIEFHYQPEEQDTGTDESHTVERVMLIGHYPDHNAVIPALVPINIEVDLEQATPAELEEFDDQVFHHIARSREAA